MKLSKVIPPSLIVVALTCTTSALVSAQTLVHIKKRNAQDFALDGNVGSTNGQSVYLWGQNQNNVNQQWVEINRGGGYYSYQKQGTNHCLDGGGADRQDVYLWNCSDNNQNQHWQKVTTDGGFYQLRKRNALDFAINGGSNGTNGQNVNLFNSSNSSRNLHWSINTIGSTTNNNCNVIDSLSELKDTLTRSNQCIQMAPGTYTFNDTNTGPSQLFTEPSILKFTGSNNTYIFDGVTFRFKTENLSAFGRADVRNFHIFGRNNSFRNLTMVDIGNEAPAFRAQAMLLDGVDNTVDGFDITTRGSYPYGYGDIFGKGG